MLNQPGDSLQGSPFNRANMPSRQCNQSQISSPFLNEALTNAINNSSNTFMQGCNPLQRGTSSLTPQSKPAAPFK